MTIYPSDSLHDLNLLDQIFMIRPNTYLEQSSQIKNFFTLFLNEKLYSKDVSNVMFLYVDRISSKFLIILFEFYELNNYKCKINRFFEGQTLILKLMNNIQNSKYFEDDIKKIVILVKEGADVNIVDFEGRNILHQVYGRQTEKMQIFLTKAIIKELDLKKDLKSKQKVLKFRLIAAGFKDKKKLKEIGVYRSKRLLDKFLLMNIENVISDLI